MTVRRLSTWTLLGSLVLLPHLAVAQPADSAPRISFGAGGGVANPVHADFDFRPWAWDADVRLRLSPHVLVEGAIGEWRHSATSVSENIPIGLGGGVLGRLEQKTTYRQRTLEANVLFTGATGRVRVTGGGGVGLLQYHRQTRQEATDCPPQLPCGVFESEFSNASGSAQGVGGAEVRLAGGLAVYGQLRFVLAFKDVAGSDLRFTSGIRWGFGR